MLNQFSNMTINIPVEPIKVVAYLLFGAILVTATLWVGRKVVAGLFFLGGKLWVRFIDALDSALGKRVNNDSGSTSTITLKPSMYDDATSALIHALLNDNDRNVRMDAAKALGPVAQRDGINLAVLQAKQKWEKEQNA